MVVVVCNEKGGSGKTNIAVNLACRLAVDGDRVVLIDSDPQRSTEVFSGNRVLSELPPLFSSVCKTGLGLGAEIDIQEKQSGVVVVDTGGRDSNEMRIALGKANFAIMPTIPSLVDLDVLERMLKVCGVAQAQNPKLKVLILCNRVSPNPSLKNDIARVRKFILDFMENNEGFKASLLDSLIYERTIYKRIFEYGKTLLEYSGNKKDKAVLEFENFFIELMEIAGGKVSVSLEKMAV